jgi:transcriptional regulator with XRE-family HTH domain
MELTIGQRIKMARIRLRITQAQLAERIGISINSLSQIESDETTNPRMSTLIALADALGVSMDYLAGRTDEGRSCEAAVEDLVPA